MNTDESPGNPRALVHATSVLIGEAAVPFGGVLNAAALLIGDSGAGKSDVALRLIAMGAKLIADDQTVLFAANGRLSAEAPSNLRGRLEIRGAGILTFESIAAGPAPVVLAVRLTDAEEIARLPAPESYGLPPELPDCAPPPLVTLRPFEASTPAKIVASAAGVAWGGFVAGIVSPTSGPFL